MSRQWCTKAGDRFVVVVARAFGSPDVGYGLEYTLLDGEFGSIRSAAAAGVRATGSDDFNIGAIRGGRLQALLWMDEVVDDAPDVLARIADAVGLVA